MNQTSEYGPNQIFIRIPTEPPPAVPTPSPRKPPSPEPEVAAAEVNGPVIPNGRGGFNVGRGRKGPFDAAIRSERIQPGIEGGNVNGAVRGDGR